MTRPHVKICIPVYDIMIWEGSLARSCYEALKSQTYPFDCSLSVARTTLIEEGRNLLIRENRENQAIYQKLNPVYSHFLFVDHDVGFTWEHIRQLLIDDKSIISGAYRPKDKPDRWVAGYCDDNGKIMADLPAVDNGIQLIEWCGAGFLLCKREALEAMEYPWFWRTWRRYGNRNLTVGEDIEFCLNARRNLLSIWIDTSVILNHEANRHEDVQADIIIS